MSGNDDYTWVTNDAARIRFEVPVSWTQVDKASTTPGLHGLIVKSPDQSTVLNFVFITRGEPEVVSEEKRIMAELDTLITDVQVTAPASNAVLNGLRVFGIAGIGTSQGRAVHWFSLAYGDGLGHGMLVTMLVETSKLDVTKPVTDRIARSIALFDPPA